MMDAAELALLPAGARVFHPGAACRPYLPVLNGAVRVGMLTESGREFLLYRVGPGESCILTTSCLLGGAAKSSPAI